MAGRKPIVAARQLKARVQIIIRATDKDVAQNTEQNRLIDMAESMSKAGMLQEFLLNCLRSKLRQDEGQTVAAYRMFEGGHQAAPQHPFDTPSHFQQPAQVKPSQANIKPEQLANIDPANIKHVVNELDANPVPVSLPDSDVADKTVSNESTPTAIIENVIREIELAATSNETELAASAPTERRRPKGNLLGAMG